MPITTTPSTSPFRAASGTWQPGYEGCSCPDDIGASGFKADLDSECNTSYGTMLINGKRKRTQWRDSLASDFVIMGTRGPGSDQGTIKLSAEAAIRSSTNNRRRSVSSVVEVNSGRTTSTTTAMSNTPTSWLRKATENSRSGDVFVEDDVYTHQDTSPTGNNPKSAGKDAFLCIVKSIGDRSL